MIPLAQSNSYSSVCVLSRFSRVWLFATLWTVACQAPLSMGFSRQEYWSGLPFPPPGDLPDPCAHPILTGLCFAPQTSQPLPYPGQNLEGSWLCSRSHGGQVMGLESKFPVSFACRLCLCLPLTVKAPFYPLSSPRVNPLGVPDHSDSAIAPHFISVPFNRTWSHTEGVIIVIKICAWNCLEVGKNDGNFHLFFECLLCSGHCCWVLWLGRQIAWAWILASPLISSVTLSQPSNFWVSTF